MRAIFLLFVLGISPLVWSRSLVQVFPGTGMAMVSIVSKNTDGSIDQDPSHLFDDLNVPVKKNFLGFGKDLTSSDRKFSFTCTQKSSNDYQCSVMIQKSAGSQIAQGHVLFQIRGPEADEILEKWHNNGPQSYRFNSSDGKIKVFSERNLFLFEYSEN